MKHAKRSRLLPNDINAALRLRNVAPVYGFGRAPKVSTNDQNLSAPTQSNSPSKPANSFSDAGGGARFTQVDGTPDLFFVEDNEVNVKSLIQAPLPPVPLEVTVSAHWLAVDASQPTIPQNPAKRVQPIVQNSELEANQPPLKKRAVETEVKPIIKHDLSRELQLYFEEVTGSLFSDNPPQLEACLTSVARGPGLAQLLPYFTQFIFKTVTKSMHNLPLLFSLMRLVNAILDNEVFQLDSYLQQLLPAIVTCLVGKRLCSSPRQNHWALRDYAAKIVQRICFRYGKKYSNVQPRFTRTVTDALSDVKRPLTTHYGAIVGLASLGGQVIDVILVPKLAGYAKKIKALLSNPKTRPVRRLEASKVFGAMAWAVAISQLNKSKTVENGPIDCSREKDTTKAPIEVTREHFSKILPRAEALYDTLSKEMGKELHPYGDAYPDAEMTVKLLINKQFMRQGA